MGNANKSLLTASVQVSKYTLFTDGNPIGCTNWCHMNKILSVCHMNEILSAWQKHFGALATPANHQDFDEEYKQQVAGEMLDIMDICSSLPAQNSEDCVSVEQVKKY